MKELRNPEFRREMLSLLLCALLFSLLAATGWISSWLLMLGLGLALMLIRWFFTRRRYRAISRLGQQLDRILHGQQTELIGENEEGELSILRSEIQKMTVRLQEQATQLSADKRRLTDAIADIFHQLRTPLTSMKLTASMLAEEELPYGKRLQLTHDLKRQLERSQWLVETLLKLSKLDAGTAAFNTEEVPVKELVRRSIAPLEIPMELKGQDLKILVGAERYRGDMEWSVEAISNILKNCMEHTPTGGHIAVTATENALYTQLIIQDSGPGFDREDIPHLFERFYRGKKPAEGSIGIGLALARAIIAAQNGTITAQNCPDGGAIFTIRFYKVIV